MQTSPVPLLPILFHSIQTPTRLPCHSFSVLPYCIIHHNVNHNVRLLAPSHAHCVSYISEISLHPFCFPCTAFVLLFHICIRPNFCSSLLSAAILLPLCVFSIVSFCAPTPFLCLRFLLCIALQGQTRSWKQCLTSSRSMKARTSPSIRRCMHTSPAPLTPTISSLSSTLSLMSSSPTTCVSVVFTEPQACSQISYTPLFYSLCLALQWWTTE